MFILEQRASTIIYNFLLSNPSNKVYLLPANICPIVPAIFLKAKQAFELVDISPSSLGMDEEIVLDKVKSNPNQYAGVLYVHSYGSEFVPRLFFQELKNLLPSLAIIDDRCLCMPTFSEPDFANFDLVIYSTGYAKYVDIGSGGYGWLNNVFHYRPSFVEYSHDSQMLFERDLNTAISHNSKFLYTINDWLNGSLFNKTRTEYRNIVQIELKRIRSLKSKINKIYSEGLPAEMQFSSEFQNWRFNIRTTHKKYFLKHIFSAGLFASSHYTSLGGIMCEGKFPKAKTLHQHIINLFNDRYFTEENAHQTVSIINTLLK